MELMKAISVNFLKSNTSVKVTLTALYPATAKYRNINLLLAKYHRGLAADSDIVMVELPSSKRFSAFMIKFI